MVSVTSINRKSLWRQQHGGLSPPPSPSGQWSVPPALLPQRLRISPTGSQSWKEDRSSGLGALKCWNTDQRDKILTALWEGIFFL